MNYWRQDRPKILMPASYSVEFNRTLGARDKHQRIRHQEQQIDRHIQRASSAAKVAHTLSSTYKNVHSGNKEAALAQKHQNDNHWIDRGLRNTRTATGIFDKARIAGQSFGILPRSRSPNRPGLIVKAERAYRFGRRITR